jgi:hypothetical protein
MVRKFKRRRERPVALAGVVLVQAPVCGSAGGGANGVGTPPGLANLDAELEQFAVNALGRCDHLKSKGDKLELQWRSGSKAEQREGEESRQNRHPAARG